MKLFKTAKTANSCIITSIGKPDLSIANIGAVNKSSHISVMQ